ncbi:MAG: DUF1631 family protein [Thermomonas sp.]
MSSHPHGDKNTAGPREPGRLLDALQELAQEHLKPALSIALGRVDDYLFNRSENSNDDTELTALRDLRRERSKIGQRFEKGVHAAFQVLSEPHFKPEQAPEGLALVEEDALEELLAKEQLIESLTRLHAPALEVLGKRVAFLFGRAALDPTDDPLNPHAIANRLLRAMDGVELASSVRIVLFKFFERELATALETLYERANALLSAAGILPYLRATVRSQPVKAAGDAAAGAHSSDPAAQAVTGGAYAGMKPAEGGAEQAAGVMQPPTAAEQAVFANLLSLLQGWRSTVAPQMPARPGQGPSQPLASQDLMSVLSLLQRDLPQQFDHRNRQPQQSLAQQLRTEVISGARKLGVAGDNIHLDGLDEDAVDLVALLFDVLLDGPQYDTDIRSKIGRMLVPYVKVAVQDRRMFLFKEHPARRLLNTVAEACEGNHGEAPQERELLGHVDKTIDRLVTEFNEDVAIFETLEQELRSYMAQNRKRFELAEKRTAEAQRGRERLEHARSATNALLTRHRGERQLPVVMDEFLSKYASHHLVQVMLRDGHGSQRHEEAMLAVGDVLLAFDHADLRAPIEELPTLPRAQIETILASSGCVGESAQQAIQSLQDALIRLAGGEPAADNTSHMPEQAIAQKPIASPQPEPILQVIAGTDALDFDAASLERMRKLAVGSWIQLATSADRMEPAKVSWISPISGRLLLVNRRGIRVLVASAEELAAMAKLDKVVVREGATPFDDAMFQVAGRLRSVSTPG